MRRRTLTILIADLTPRLRVTVELLPEPITTDGEELPVIPAAPAVPRELRETARPPAKVVQMPRRRVA